MPPNHDIIPKQGTDTHPTKIRNQEDIRQTQDRTHTLVLLDAVLAADPSSAHWSECLETLRWLEDYRTIQPLRAYVNDSQRPEDFRREVARTLSSFDLTTTSAQRRSWWASDDPALAEYALRLMEPTEAELVIAVAEQQEHRLQAVALTTLAMNFELPRYQSIMVRCLNSDRPDTQLAAVSGIIWDEPLAAEPVLQQLIDCGAEGVEQAAADALQYYPSLATLEALRRRMRPPLSQAMKQQMRSSIDFIEGTIDYELQRCGPDERTRLTAWLAATNFVADDSPTPSGITRPPKPAMTYDEAALDKALDTTTGSLVDKVGLLRSIDWTVVPAIDRSRIADRLAGHPDPDVRAISTTPLARWNDTPRLLTLAEDEHAAVRKAAMYALASVKIDRGIASLAVKHLNDSSVLAAAEVLATFAKHADPDNRRTVLVGLAKGDGRYSVRRAAVALLDQYTTDAELQVLLGVLSEPPLVNWAVHTAILETNAVSLASREDLAKLAMVDNIHVAAPAARALERQEAQRGR